ncbi:uncharacterized protein LOC127500693 isoform X3 [Ctenopharyngodon idella]|uniref:uncharacterized protein LOC127500693 isoform X3 n=1 Tax=Ctenopharyngodon idella TaxID=7959 RepID=UPI0022303773|nr:uncharacterized protein LOC127500693 isoform X3 [Ctenopharyngodon idella]
MDTSSNSNEYKHYQDCPTKVPFNRLNLLLLLCLVYHSESSSISVSGIKGGSVTLSCDFEDREILVISLISRSENIPVCQEKNCSGRVFKEGSCDIIIKDLIFSDAGKYILIVYYNNDQREVERRILEYHLHIQDEISVKTGEELKMDVLLINADKVETNSSGEWTEVWTRGHGVRSDRLTDSDGNLTINDFTSTDTGTYRVLDSEGEILITVTVTESSTRSKGKLDTDEDKPDEKYTLQQQPPTLVQFAADSEPGPATLPSTSHEPNTPEWAVSEAEPGHSCIMQETDADGVTPKERVLMFGSVGLAVFVFFLATVIAGGIIYHCGWQRGWKEAKHGALNN